jgi:predicted deacylase
MLRLVRSILLLTAALLCASASAQQPPFTVGTATAAAGQRANGWIEVSAGVDAATRIPVIVLRGAKPGPVLALAAGSHGTEYASILALERLATELDPAAISGTVIILPLINPASFEEIVPHVNPVDRKNMNRFFPGKADGTQTERVSLEITRQVVERSGYLIDFHGGDLDESLRPYSYWTRTGDAQTDGVSREMVLAFGLDHIIISDDRPKDPNASRYLENTARTRGKPGITVEAGYAGVSEPADVEALVRGTLSVMRYLKMLPGAVTPVEHPVWLEKVASLTSPETGIFYPLVARGSYVEAGMKVGYITDYFGNTTFQARAPATGVVLHICPLPSMKKGDTIINIGVPASHAP